jgi:outer membrane biosynthesis protein TonB
MDILDRDMFDPNPGTTEHTSWTMTLLDRLDAALGDTVMDQPMIELARPEAAVGQMPDRIVEDVRQGKYDDFFGKAPDKLSQLAHEAQAPLPTPTVELLSSTPFRPVAFEPPPYPLLAKAARVEGDVSFKLRVSADGTTTNFQFLSKQPLLLGPVENMAARWKFPQGVMGQEIQATLRFKTNCPAPHP